MECTFQDSENLYFLMEYVERGTLEFVMKMVGKLPVETVRFMAAEIILALEALHGVEISHRDLKPGNVLLD